MTRRVRQLYLLSILLFSAIALPAILAYISGYRFNFSDLSLQKTGSLYVTTLPKKAIVSIKDINYNEKSPAIINQLAPSEYEVTISLENYITWSDNIEIKQQRSVILKNILLFLREPDVIEVSRYPKDILPKINIEKINDFSPQIQYTLSKMELSKDYKIDSINGPVITLLDNSSKKLYTINETTDSSQITLISENVSNFEWDIESDQMLFFTPYEINVYDHTSKQIHVITRSSQIINEAIWHPRGGYIAYSSENSVKIIEIRLSEHPNTTTLYYGNKPQDIKMSVKGDKLYLSDEMINKEIRIMEL